MEMGCKLTEYEWPDHWYFRDERRLKHASIKARHVSSNLVFNGSCAMQLQFVLGTWHNDIDGGFGRMQT